ncbi:hypothetical protein ACG04R_18160 [Roseateles sp. BYS78W]|uniref:Uncharacterized protein n=1 Tax=Pelomonas candidula TaxID=3299025 RepID=A0ABW7HGI5_9BURK
MTPSHTVFSPDERSKLPEINDTIDERRNALLKRIKTHLVFELARCVRECPPAHLAHLALGSQELGVSIRSDNLTFSVRFVRDLDVGMADPFEPRARIEYLLPDIPAVANAPGTPDFAEEMAHMAGLSEAEWIKILLRTMSAPKRLAALMRDPLIVDEVRNRVQATFENHYLPLLDDEPEAILCWTCERLKDKAWLDERRRLRAKAKRLAAAKSA